MNEAEFIKLCKEKVTEWERANSHEASLLFNVNDVYCVWVCKTLQNSKGLFSTTTPDGMYFELTYNGDSNELYFDAYKKVENIQFEL